MCVEEASSFNLIGLGVGRRRWWSEQGRGLLNIGKKLSILNPVPFGVEIGRVREQRAVPWRAEKRQASESPLYSTTPHPTNSCQTTRQRSPKAYKSRLPLTRRKEKYLLLQFVSCASEKWRPPHLPVVVVSGSRTKCERAIFISYAPSHPTRGF